ncbi:MAG: hypothetical protein AB1762_22245 [Gemmatimonadota bacterium]
MGKRLRKEALLAELGRERTASDLGRYSWTGPSWTLRLLASQYRGALPVGAHADSALVARAAKSYAAQRIGKPLGSSGVLKSYSLRNRST